MTDEHEATPVTSHQTESGPAWRQTVLGYLWDALALHAVTDDVMARLRPLNDLEG